MRPALRHTLSRDLGWWVHLTGLYNGQLASVGRPRPAPSSFWATDASTDWGMGGFCDGEYFAVSWKQLRDMEQEPFYPFREDVENSEHINYLELFAVYWALTKWGSRLHGMTIPMWVDNTAAIAMSNQFKGTQVHVRLLKQILALCVTFNVRIYARYINTKDNVLADLLSRGDLPAFHRARQAWRNMDVMDKDREDWMLAGVEVDSLDKDYGPYDVAACCDEWGRNSHLCVYWTEAMDCLCQDWAGRNVLSNPPFSRALEILAHALSAKFASQLGPRPPLSCRSG